MGSAMCYGKKSGWQAERRSGTVSVWFMVQFVVWYMYMYNAFNELN